MEVKISSGPLRQFLVIEKEKAQKRKGLGSCAPHRPSAKHRKRQLSKKHYFPMARRHEMHVFQNSDNSNTKSSETMENHAFPGNEKLKCLKSKSCISRKSLKTMGNHAFPAKETCIIQVIFW